MAPSTAERSAVVTAEKTRAQTEAGADAALLVYDPSVAFPHSIGYY